MSLTFFFLIKIFHLYIFKIQFQDRLTFFEILLCFKYCNVVKRQCAAQIFFKKVFFRVTSEPKMSLFAQLCFFYHAIRFPNPFALKSLLAENWSSENIKNPARVILLHILGLIHEEIITFLQKKIRLNNNVMPHMVCLKTVRNSLW